MKVFIFIWVGQFISLLGSRLTGFGLNVWIYEQTQSTTDFGLLVMCTSVTSLVVSPVTGFFVDRWNRRWTMIVCDLCEALCTLCIAWLFLTEQIEIWHLYLNAVITSCFNSCQSTAYAAATTLIVPKEYLIRASGLTSLDIDLLILV
ncbi:MAG: MFS transporter, partial [Cyanobacteria bacterium J06635_10]